VIELPDKPNQRWVEYLEAEGRGTRNQKLGALDRFIASMLTLPQETWMRWAIELCEKHELKQLAITIRQPLFERVLLPALKMAWQSGVPGSLRLLAGLFDHVCNSKSCRLELPVELQSRDLLLREELRRNPNDQKAGLMLASSMARYVAQTLHELVVPEKLLLSAAVGLGHMICVVKIARKDVIQGQNLAI